MMKLVKIVGKAAKQVSSEALVASAVSVERPGPNAGP
jgi:hypothetical protein